MQTQLGLSVYPSSTQMRLGQKNNVLRDEEKAGSSQDMQLGRTSSVYLVQGGCSSSLVFMVYVWVSGIIINTASFFALKRVLPWMISVTLIIVIAEVNSILSLERALETQKGERTFQGRPISSGPNSHLQCAARHFSLYSRICSRSAVRLVIDNSTAL